MQNDHQQWEETGFKILIWTIATIAVQRHPSRSTKELKHSMTSNTSYTFNTSSIQKHIKLQQLSQEVFKDGSGLVSSRMITTQSTNFRAANKHLMIKCLGVASLQTHTCIETVFMSLFASGQYSLFWQLLQCQQHSEGSVWRFGNCF